MGEQTAAFLQEQREEQLMPYVPAGQTEEQSEPLYPGAQTHAPLTLWQSAPF